MYRAYQILDDPGVLWNNQEFYQIGQRRFANMSTKTKSELSKYINAESVLDASVLQRDWFPDMKADIFISHYHADTEKAIALAGWLYSTFGLIAFVDGCVWLHSRDLLKEIDNVHCKNTDNTYNYDKRNLSTSQVHMMICSALTMMIDRCECLFFLNTPDSVAVSAVNTTNTKTESPWIYYEISVSKFIRRIRPSRPITKAMNESRTIQFPLDLNHLPKLSLPELLSWQIENGKDQMRLGTIQHPLDWLYDTLFKEYLR